MSNIKPWGYIHPSATKTLLDRDMCDLTITRKQTHKITMPLYTADQLNEAVAAERERCAKALDKVAKQLAGMLGGHLTEEGIAIKEACAARVEQEAAALREGGE